METGGDSERAIAIRLVIHPINCCYSFSYLQLLHLVLCARSDQMMVMMMMVLELLFPQ